MDVTGMQRVIDATGMHHGCDSYALGMQQGCIMDAIGIHRCDRDASKM